MTTSATIRHHLEGAQHELEKAQAEVARRQARVDQLTQQLREAKVMEAAESRRREQMRAVMARMRHGQYPAGLEIGRMWWHSDDEKFIDHVTTEELAALQELERAGLVAQETKRGVAA